MKYSLIRLVCSLFFLISNISLHASWAETTLNSLSLREKIGQLFMVATAPNLTIVEESLAKQLINCPYKKNHDYIEQLIVEYHIGGIIFLFKGSPEQQITLTNRFQQVSKLPLLIGQDCEWGLSMRLYNTIQFPHNMTLGAVHDPKLIYELGKEIGKQCKAMGVHINFAPVVDVNTNPDNPIIGDRSFGDDKEKVAELGMAFMRGLQDAGVLACAKHFPGHGDTLQDSHLELPTIMATKDEIINEFLYTFKKLIDANVACVMNAHLKIPALDRTRNLPSSLSPKIVTDLLRNELGFKGLIITDGMGMMGVTKFHKAGNAELKALLAGNDIILCPVDVPKAVELIEQAVLDGTLTMQDLDTRVLKILQAKEKLTIHEDRFVDPESAHVALETPEAYALKKQLYERAITIVKNNHLPLNDHDTAFVQIGGYMPSEFEEIIQKNCSIPTYHISTDVQKENADYILAKLDSKKTIIVSIFDMVKSPAQNFGISDASLTFIESLKASNKNIILTLFGSPYSLCFFDDLKNDTIVMVYEDDPDAQQAAANVILGKLTPKGVLPITL